MIVTEMCDLHRVVAIVLTNEPLRRYRSGADVHICDLAATWPNGSGNGLQSRVSGFDSRRRLQITPAHRLQDRSVVTVWSQKTHDGVRGQRCCGLVIAWHHMRVDLQRHSNVGVTKSL